MPLADVTLTAPVEPRQVLQAGANYRQHVIELVVAGLTKNSDRTPEEAREFAAKMMDERQRSGEPYFFIGLPACVVGDDVPLVLPPYSEVHDWELELAVVIGREAFRVSREDALDHVAGYTIVNDITTRDLVFRKDMKEIGTDWYRAKNAPGFLPTGPFLVPAPFVDAGRPRRAPRAQRTGDAGRVHERPALRHPRPDLRRLADDATAARRPPAHRQPGRQRPALEAVPAGRRRDDRLDRGSRHPGRAERGWRMTTPSENPADLDRTHPEAEIGARAAAYRNWGRWGEDDVLGTLNLIDPAKRIEAAALVTEGRVISLSQSFDTNGPQKGWRRRTNPVHTMTDTGVDAERGNQGFPHGIGGADDVIAMPLQCSTQWDGLGHIFDHGMAWNGRRAGDVVTSEGDLVTGIEHAASVIVSRGVLLDVGRHLEPGTGELPDGRAITAADLDACAAAQGVTRRPR